jgi:hypothetical protein
MSRSRKKTPCGSFWHRARSDKPGKQDANRRLRRRVRQVLAVDPDPDVLPALREVSDVWSMPKDGKHYFGTTWPKMLRK